MFYKVIYNGAVIDILKDPTWVRWLKKTRIFILSDIVSANGVISSDKQSVYNLTDRDPFENAKEDHKSVSLEETTEDEYNSIKEQLAENAIDKNSEEEGTYGISDAPDTAAIEPIE